MLVAGFALLALNVALNRPVAFSRPPDYPLTTDAGDAQQLTDGVQAASSTLWTDKLAVGWGPAVHKPVSVSIDLGQPRSVDEVTWSTAAGRANVRWPAKLLLYLSEDGKLWDFFGNLRDLDPQPEPAAYTRHVFRAAIKGHGRFVRLIAVYDLYAFCDEIEVLGGDGPAPAAHPQQTHDPERHAWWMDRIAGYVKALPAGAEAAAAAVALDPPRPENGRAILPLGEPMRRLFALGGRGKLQAWKSGRYDPLGPLELRPGPAALRIRAMPGERRSDAVNIFNGTPSKVRLRLRLTGLPPSAHAELYQVEFVDSAPGIDAASALLPVKDAVEVEAGMNRQLWLLVRPSAPGRFEGALEGDGLRIPISLNVSKVAAQRPSLHLGGWDYTDTASAYDVGPGNREALIEMLAAHGVDVTWAHRGVLDSEASLDAWVARWPQARARFVFLGGPRIDARLGAAIAAAAARLKARSPGALFGVLPVDEPATAQQAVAVRAWSGIVRPHALLFEDPRGAALGPAIDAADIVSPQWLDVLAMPPEQRALLSRAKQLWFYETRGPVRSLDPVSYHRLAAWVAFRAGARGIGFWSFADAGGGSSWDEFDNLRGGGFAPEYIDQGGVALSKHLLAIEEGLEDAQRFAMLRDAAPLQARIDQVLAGLDRAPAEEILWSTAKDRALPDEVAGAALDLLEKQP